MQGFHGPHHKELKHHHQHEQSHQPHLSHLDQLIQCLVFLLVVNLLPQFTQFVINGTQLFFQFDHFVPVTTRHKRENCIISFAFLVFVCILLFRYSVLDLFVPLEILAQKSVTFVNILHNELFRKRLRQNHYPQTDEKQSNDVSVNDVYEVE